VNIKEVGCKNKKEQDRFEIKLYDSIDEISSLWADLTADEDIFLSTRYFRSLESSSPKSVSQKYALLYEKGEIIAYFPIQISEFNARESLKDRKHNDSSHLRSSLAKIVRIRGLVAGNMLVSGEYMFRFVDERYTGKEKFEILETVLGHCITYYQSKKRPINVVFTKDIPVSRKMDSIGVKNSKFKPFSVEPLMVLHIKEEWSHFSDYLGALTSKYRVRAKRALKKSAHLTIREIGLGEIKSRVEEYFPLYKEVFEGLDFSLFELPKMYFASLKEHLGDDFIFKVAEDSSGNLVGFYTMIHNRGELHAHFLGYDKVSNKQSQLYITMLYKMISYGVENDFKLVDFGRTALEIKSSVGAIPHHYELYLKHTNSIANLFAGPIISILNRKTDWQPRHPFRVE
jgi:hypothetical protein